MRRSLWRWSTLSVGTVCKIVVTSPVAKDAVGTYVRHCVVFYVDGNKEKDCYLFLDGWANWRPTNRGSQSDPVTYLQDRFQSRPTCVVTASWKRV